MLKRYIVFPGVLMLFFCQIMLSARQGAMIEYTDILGRDCSLLNTAETETFLEQKKENPNYPLFRWTSNQKTDARYPAYRNSPKLLMFGLDVCEMIFRFKETKADSLYVMFYNRGDMEELDKEDFTELCGTVQKKLEEFTGVKGVEKKGKLTGQDRLYCYFYITENFVFELKWSIRKMPRGYSCEYIQLEIYRFDPKNDPRKKDVSRSAASEGVKENLADNLQTEGSGIWIDNIPMVDQGSKGYCVPAVLERVLRYYGNEDVSQHVLAQLAESDDERGTNVAAVRPIIKRMGSKFGVRISPAYQRTEGIEDYHKIVKKYNSFAKKAKQEKIEIVTETRGKVTYYFWDATLAQMDAEIMKEMWVSQKSDYGKFKKAIRENIRKGIPVIWSVRLGMFPEEQVSQQSRGGHMRLIIGLDETKNTVFYSDTWGQGHEKKTMPMDQAWAITSAYFSLLPRK